MGIGALGLHHYMTNRQLFLKSTKFNTKLIVGGVLILALAKFLVAAAEGNLLIRRDVLIPKEDHQVVVQSLLDGGVGGLIHGLAQIDTFNDRAQGAGYGAQTQFRG